MGKMPGIALAGAFLAGVVSSGCESCGSCFGRWSGSGDKTSAMASQMYPGRSSPAPTWGNQPRTPAAPADALTHSTPTSPPSVPSYQGNPGLGTPVQTSSATPFNTTGSGMDRGAANNMRAMDDMSPTRSTGITMPNTPTIPSPAFPASSSTPAMPSSVQQAPPPVLPVTGESNTQNYPPAVPATGPAIPAPGAIPRQ